MDTRTKIILIEDQIDDSNQIINTLQKYNNDLLISRVNDNRLDKELVNKPWDAVVYDCIKPHPRGLDVLKIYQENELDIPFVFVFSSINEKNLIRIMKAGANNYVMKSYLKHLPSIVEYEIHKAERRKEDRQDVQELYKKLNLYQHLIDYSPSIIYAIDSEDDYSYKFVSKNLYELMGHEPSEMINNSMFWLKHIHPDDINSTQRAIKKNIKKGEGNIEYRFLHADGTYLWISDNHKVINDKNSGSVEVVGSWTNITSARKLSEELNYKKSHDNLTGFLNRYAFEIKAQKILENIQFDNSEHTICYIDIDQFKVINDTCGHVAGDELISEFAQILHGIVRNRDLLARISGDDFCILLQYCTVNQTNRLINLLRSKIENFNFTWNNHTFDVSISIGLVQVRKPNQEICNLLSQADTACNAAKEEGRNSVYIVKEEDRDFKNRKSDMRWVSQINNAFSEDRFCLYFQTIEELNITDNNKIRGEVLVRMNNDSGELVPPGFFLPAAEKYNLMHKIDRWVIETLLAFLRDNSHIREKVEHVGINLSGQTIGDKNLLEFIQKNFKRYRIPPQKICFEITETSAVTRLNHAIEFIRILREQGCSFALDDFGSGMSSFAYLKNIPVDFLKIDGMFVKNIDEDPVNYALVKSINEIGKVMGKRTIAEFVETEKIKELLKQIKVDFVQGYGISKPEPLIKLL